MENLTLEEIREIIRKQRVGGLSFGFPLLTRPETSSQTGRRRTQIQTRATVVVQYYFTTNEDHEDK